MKSVESVRILFVDNSHTYNCDIPYRVKLLAEVMARTLWESLKRAMEEWVQSIQK